MPLPPVIIKGMRSFTSSPSRALARLLRCAPLGLISFLAGCLHHAPPEKTGTAVREISKAMDELDEGGTSREKALADDAALLTADYKAFGIYQWNKDSTYAAGLQEEISTMGTSPTFAMYFVDRDM